MGKAVAEVDDKQIQTLWVPSPNQSAVLEAARTGQYRSVKAICAQAGVPRACYYDWMNNDDDFKDAWANLWKGSAQNAMPLVLAAMIRKAIKGDVAAARLVSEIAEATRTQDMAVLKNLSFNVTLVKGEGAKD